jgi:hypothetical protein
MTPYDSVPARGFWRTAVAEPEMTQIAGLWDPKFRILPRHRVSTYGSCFAQHIGRALDARGFNWFRAETAPEGLSEENAQRFNYGIFSARTGNIYTTSLLLQWVRWALGHATPPDEIWDRDGRVYDPFRPRIEPDGFASRDELLASRAACLEAFRRSIVDADVFVFTLGLTERWLDTGGYEYPMCPGTVAGQFDAQRHQFDNMGFAEVLGALRDAIALMSDANPKLRFILTVSPVPLTATNSGKHVLVATMQSKSILRAVAGQLADRKRNIDYFPSYEIISAPPFKGSFFEPNQRSVATRGVNFVMDSFFRDMQAKFAGEGAGDGPGKGASKGKGKGKGKMSPEARQRRRDRAGTADTSADVVCEEELLGAFGPRT